MSRNLVDQRKGKNKQHQKIIKRTLERNIKMEIRGRTIEKNI